MSVLSESSRLTAARRVVLELLLSDHPVDCGPCEASGSCRLEALAHRYQVRDGHYAGARHAVVATPDGNPFIVRDPAKCILCGLCVQACDEVEGVGALRIVGRGFEAHVEAEAAIAPATSGCRSCGRCVSVCPAGALTERKRQGVGRLAEVRKVGSVCPHCGMGCGLEINAQEEEIVGITCGGPAATPGGYLCVRGRYAYDFVHSPDRLTAPLARHAYGVLGGQLREVSWPAALGFAADGLQRVLSRYGPEAVAVLCSCRSTNEANYLLAKFARAVLGTNNIDNTAGACETPQVIGDDLALGTDLMTNSFEDFERAAVILLVGSDPEQTHPVLGSWLKRAARKGTRLIVMDPRMIDLVPHAETYLRLRVGSEVALVNAFIKVILDEGLYDREFVEAHTEGLEGLVESVQSLRPGEVARVTGLAEAEIVRVAREIAAAESAMFLHTCGAAHPMCGHEIALAMRNLALLTGNVGREGAGTNALRVQNNAQGVCDMGGLPDVLPGYQPVSDAAARAKFEAAWGVKLPREPGVGRAGLLDAILTGKIKALYVMGENPAVSYPDPGRTRLALESLELLIVQDIFPTETAQRADAVFPAAGWAEVDGTYTSTERRVQRVRAAVPSPGEVPADWEIICRLSEQMGYPMGYTSPKAIWDEVASLCPLFAGISHERLETGGLQWPCTDSRDPGRRQLHVRPGTEGVRESFRPAQPAGPLAGADLDEDYPLLLTTGQRLYHYQPGTTTQRAQGLEDVWQEDVLEVSAADAARFKVADGRRIRVVSRYGEAVATVQVSDRTAEGVLFLSPHPRTGGREVGLYGMDRLWASAEYGACAVRIESLEAAVIGSHGG
jgi:formate dehydrogenase alpha subunit